MGGDQGYSSYYDMASDEETPFIGDYDFAPGGQQMSALAPYGQALIGSLVTMGAPPGGLDYVPDLAPVGSKSTYFPRSVNADALALTFLGFDAGIPGGGVSQQADMSSGTGAWDPSFRGALTAFQKSVGITADGWIGPQSRTKLKEKVDEKNRTAPNIPAAPQAPAPVPPPSPSNQVPVNPSVPGQPQPATGFAALTTGQKAAVVAGGLALLGGGYYLYKRSR